MPQRTQSLYEFGPFRLDTAQQFLSRANKAVPLTPKTYDMLLVLVESHGKMLSKDELMKAVWPDSFVEESNLSQQISLIRKALGESPGEDRYIATVSGRGYRFVATVNGSPEPIQDVPFLVDKEDNGRALLTPAEPARAALRWHKQYLIWAFGLLVVLAAFSYNVHRNQTPKAPSTAGPRSLAILPFQSLRREAASDFLGVSLADAVITKLGYVRSLTVRPTSAIDKYRNQTIDIPKVAGELHVDTLLAGTFIRDGDDLRITSQLIDVKTENVLWRGTFDLKYKKLLTVQDTVAQQIVKGLELSLSPIEMERLRPHKEIDPLAYEYYLRGVDLYSRNDFGLAIKMLQKSTEIDPGHSLTWAHLGRSQSANASFELGGRQEYHDAQASYEKALFLQPALIEAQIYMANLLTDTGRVERAVPLLKKVLEANPNHAEARWELGYAYRFAGMLRESVTECERARQLDPGVKLTSSTLNGYLYLGQYDRFLESLPKPPYPALILFYRGLAEYLKGDRAKAKVNFDAAFELRPSLLQATVGKALSAGIAHQESKGLQLLRETENKVGARGVGDPEATYKIAQSFAVLGDKASALRVLRHSIENGFFSYPYMIADPLLDGVRYESEFTRLMKLARERHEAFKRIFF
jgi:DNA-binding winged helix-turn-helix (wHTH) protein/TolB-like protein/tetratricopeptide (TPR) repeat protein